MITSKSTIKDIKDAIRMFGEYSYQDKGANEVMNLHKYVAHCNSLSGPEVITYLKEVMKYKNHSPFVDNLLCELQEHKDFESIVEDEEVGNYF